MGQVTLRNFVWTSGTSGVPEIRVLPGERQLPISLSEVLNLNAVREPIRFQTTLYELRLLGSYLRGGPGPIQVDGEAFRASAGHIQRFVSESVGLGMLAAVVSAAGSLEVLPPAGYPKAGVRPDLLFALPHSVLAGEARGRSQKPPRKPGPDQHQRLAELLPWAAKHGHDLVMTWAWLTPDGITVDLFTSADEPAELDLTAGADDLGLFALDLVQPRVREASADQTLAAARQRVRAMETSLFDTAPPAVSLGGQEFRGAWVPLDLLGPSTGSLLFGVLASPLPVAAQGLVRQRLGGSVSIRGRVLAAVTDEVAWEKLPD